jgi:hypothetical protein
MELVWDPDPTALQQIMSGDRRTKSIPEVHNDRLKGPAAEGGAAEGGGGEERTSMHGAPGGAAGGGGADKTVGGRAHGKGEDTWAERMKEERREEGVRRRSVHDTIILK